MTTHQEVDHYIEPGWFTTNVFNRAVGRLTKLGISVWGSRVLEVRGRRSGEWRSTPVNLLVVDGSTHLVAARGLTQWVRNVRAAGGGRLRLGRGAREFRATELPPAETAAVLRAYLKRWNWEVGQFFEGVDAAATDDELVAVAHRHPVFRIEFLG